MISLTNIQNYNASCSPPQIITFNKPFSSVEDLASLIILNTSISEQIVSIEDLERYNNQCKIIYSSDDCLISYSIDSICWSCYLEYNKAISALSDLSTDFYIRVKISGKVGGVYQLNSDSYSNYTDWSVSLMTGFDFKQTCSSSNSNLYNPYANMDCAIQLQTQLAETVSCMFGIQAYYFKVNGVNSSADITFKEYALKSVESVKQVKLMIQDGTMPSSRPEFSDLGLDFQTDWEVEITKGTFATAFGSTAQPQEGDFVYIPMMKRMWSVNGAWEEKNQTLMWVGTSFKLTLVKYQDDTSINKDNVEGIVNEIVKTKYEDLFDDEETLNSGIESAVNVNSTPINLSPVFESDACRKYVSEFVLNSIKNANTNNATSQNNTLYYKGTQICDSYYSWVNNTDETSTAIIYQRNYCGDEFSISFLININQEQSSSQPVILIDNLNINIEYTENKYFITCKDLKVLLEPNMWYLVILRGSKQLNTCDLTCAKYTYPVGIPIYKIQKYHYYFDIDNAEIVTKRFSNELTVASKSDVCIYTFKGLFSNFKLLNIYNDNISELLMQNPTNQHLLINDTALPFLGLYGVRQY